MRILVTGGAGYIGSHAVRLFLERGHDVWVVDNLSFGHRAAVPEDRLLVADLKDVHRLDQYLLEKRIEAVVHFAASTFVGESMQEPAKYYQNNVINTLNFLECLRRLGIDKFVFSSTAATFGVPAQMPITEETPQQPINPYGQTKLAVEKALHAYAQAYKLGYAALRYFNAAGASPDGKIGEDHTPETHLIPLAIAALRGQTPPLKLFGSDYPTPDGTCIRDYIHVDDLASAHLLALENLKPGSELRYNLGIGRGYSNREVLRIVGEVVGQKVPAEDAPRRPGDPPVLIASSEKIQRELGWKPCYTDLRRIVETAWNWHQKHPNGYGDRK
jgi:UDP-glucose-4-epimerase GalE